MTAPGVFTISLDTELAWGSFDKGGIERHGPAYRATRGVVDRLCEVFAAHEVPATWAVVAHLVTDCDGHDTAEPSARRAWLAEAPCQTGADRDLWYAPDLLERIRDCETTQDVGLHGYAHLPFGTCDRAAADAELAAAVDAAADAGIDPASFVYPRNDVAHADLLAEHGIEVYRGVDARWYERRALDRRVRKPFRFLDEAASVTPRPVVPTRHDGVVNVPGSQVLRPDHGPWRWTPDGSQVERAKKGLDRAAETGGVFHLWWHPFNLGRDPAAMLEKVERILTYADRLRRTDSIDVCSLREVGTMTRAGRWDPQAGTTETDPGDEIA